MAFHQFAFSGDHQSLLQPDAALRSPQEAHAFCDQVLLSDLQNMLYPIRLYSHVLSTVPNLQTFLYLVQVPMHLQRAYLLLNQHGSLQPFDLL